MTRIRFEDLPSTNTPRNAENLNKLNNIVISPTEPTTGEEVWLQKGKNLCNITSVTPYNYGSGLPTSTTSSITINNFDKNNINFKVNANAYIYALTNIIKLKPNTTYTLSYDRTNTNYSGSNSRCYILNYDNSTYSMNGSLLVDNGTSANRTFTTNSKGTIAIAWGFSNDGNGATVNISNIQLEQGEAATSYEPYVDKKIYTKSDNGVYEIFYEENEVLYNNPNGTQETIRLNKSITKYKYIEIFYKFGDNYKNSIKIENAPNCFATLEIQQLSNNEDYYINEYKCEVYVWESEISFERARNISFSTTGIKEISATNNIKITKVVGYKN